jgi:hypothetical protein
VQDVQRAHVGGSGKAIKTSMGGGGKLHMPKPRNGPAEAGVISG